MRSLFPFLCLQYDQKTKRRWAAYSKITRILKKYTHDDVLNLELAIEELKGKRDATSTLNTTGQIGAEAKEQESAEAREEEFINLAKQHLCQWKKYERIFYDGRRYPHPPQLSESISSDDDSDDNADDSELEKGNKNAGLYTGYMSSEDDDIDGAAPNNKGENNKAVPYRVRAMPHLSDEVKSFLRFLDHFWSRSAYVPSDEVSHFLGKSKVRSNNQSPVAILYRSPDWRWTFSSDCNAQIAAAQALMKDNTKRSRPTDSEVSTANRTDRRGGGSRPSSSYQDEEEGEKEKGEEEGTGGEQRPSKKAKVYRSGGPVPV